MSNVKSEICPRCKGPLRPENHGLHHLDWAVGQPICPKCFQETRAKKVARLEAKGEVFNPAVHPALFKERLHAELKALIEERAAVRNAIIADKEANKAAIREEVRTEEINNFRRLSFWSRLKLLFNPFG